jgi:hypothetical protein
MRRFETKKFSGAWVEGVSTSSNSGSISLRARISSPVFGGSFGNGQRHLANLGR